MGGQRARDIRLTIPGGVIPAVQTCKNPRCCHLQALLAAGLGMGKAGVEASCCHLHHTLRAGWRGMGCHKISAFTCNCSPGEQGDDPDAVQARRLHKHTLLQAHRPYRR